jgi:multiple sugar transport system ATP-binding protein
MASITFKNLNKVYPNGFVSVKNVSLEFKTGQFVTFYGPHGCGKSAILRMIGGLEEISSGYIYFDQLLINTVPPPNRPLAMAFQNYALYPHLNVYENMALGLRIRNKPKKEIDKRVYEAADFLGLSHVLHKKIRSISEADKQQVALGRAIVCKPKVLLVDEDFSHQDANRRKEMIVDIKRINRELGITVLYVTNEYHEAISVGDWVVFMEKGEVLKVESTKDIAY